jgi:phosphoserine phosphatase
MTRRMVIAVLLVFGIVASAAAVDVVSCAGIYAEIKGFSEGTNKALQGFFERYEETKGRKVAVFDFDGTLMGQVPFYAADELFISQSEEGFFKSQDLPDIAGVSPSSSPIQNYLAIEKKMGHKFALLWRVKTYKGHKITVLRQRAMDFYTEHYLKKIFPPMRRLVHFFFENGFEVWVITGTTEFYVDRFIPKYFGIHPCRVVGNKTIVHDGVITNIPAGPVTEKDGKVDAIETFIKTKPLFVAGNSMGDANMLKYCLDVSLVINPGLGLRNLAEENSWIIEEIPDKPLPDSTHYYKKYGIKPNR